MTRELDFERPVLELERQIDQLRREAAGRDSLANIVATNGIDKSPAKKKGKRKRAPDYERQLSDLEARARVLREQIFSKLSRWQIVQLARHPSRPYALDYVTHAFSNFVELHGDRGFADDRSIVGGLARLDGRSVMVIGHQKGRTTNENLTRNFGMPRPEGYRKALRLMRVAERFGLPIVTLIDTPGAYPGIGAEERGQAQAIAEALEGMASLSVPVVTVVIGEGGSGGALAIGVANRVLMMEYGIYSVISPEGCASILFKDAAYAERAADALRLTAVDLVELGVVDDVITEPTGGAHRDIALAGKRLAAAVAKQLVALRRMPPRQLIADRYEKFRRLGALGAPVAPPPVKAATDTPRTRRPERPAPVDGPAPELMEEGALGAEGTLPVAPAEPHPTGVEDRSDGDSGGSAPASVAPEGVAVVSSVDGTVVVGSGGDAASESRRSAGVKAAAKKSAGAKAAAKKSAGAKATAKKSAGAKPTARKSAAAKSSARKPAAAKSSARKPTAAKSSARKPAGAKPTAKKSAGAKPTPKKSAAAKSTAKKSAGARVEAKRGRRG